MYVPENEGYFMGLLDAPLGDTIVYVLQEVRRQNDEIILVSKAFYEYCFPRETNYLLHEGRTYELHIRVHEDGTFQYLKNILLDEGI